MAAFRVMVERCEPRTTKREEPYLHLYVKGPGATGYVTCYEQEWFELVTEAFANQVPVELDIVTDDNVGPRGKPYRRVIGARVPNAEEVTSGDRK